MRLLIITIVMMGSTALLMEFALLDTVRRREEASRASEEAPGPGDRAGGAVISASDSARRAARRALDEARARTLWEAASKARDPAARARLLRSVIAIPSSYRFRALEALGERGARIERPKAR